MSTTKLPQLHTFRNLFGKGKSSRAEIVVAARILPLIVHRQWFKRLFAASCLLVAALYTLSTLGNLLSVQAAAGVNNTVNVQGKVTNSNGTNVADGTYDFVFKLYNGASSGSTNTFTESWTSASLFSQTISGTAPAAGGESVSYAADTNESSLQPGEFLWNTTKKEAVKIVSVNTAGTGGTITISPTAQAWANTDTITNEIYVKDGIFQVALNSLNADPAWGTTDFTQDTIYLGVNFNSDGEMKPRSQFTTVPYAFRAKSAATVDGLSVASGKTLTVSNSLTLAGTDGKTLNIGGNNITFTTSAATSLTLPTSGTLATLAGTEALTNKTVNGLNISSTTGTLTIAAGKTLTANNSVSLSGTDGIAVNFGGNNLTLTTSGATSLTLPTSGTVCVTSTGCNQANTNTGSGAAGQVAFYTGTNTQSSDSNLVWDNSNKRLGIGATPLSKLDVNGGVAIGSYAGNNAAPSNGLIVSGMVGIGTNNPGSALSVVGTSSVASVNTSSNKLSADGTFATSSGWTVGAGWTIAGGVATHTNGGGTNSLSGTTTVSSGIMYQINFTTSNATTGSVDVTLGGNDAGVVLTNSASQTVYIEAAAANATLAFVPTTNYNGSITGVTIYPVTPSIADAAIQASNGNTTPLELRTGTDGNANIFIGSGSGSNTTTGYYNTATGYQALYVNSTGSYNTADGTLSLNNNTTGTKNTGNGYFSLGYNTTGSYNTAQGNQALEYNTTGGYNTGIGSHALFYNTTGSYNTAQGYTALYRTTGSYNTGSGDWVMYFNLDGSNNTALGYQAGYGTSGMTGTNNNTFIGYQSGFHIATSSSGNVMLGYQAGYSETGSNKLYIANSNTSSPLIYGDFAAGSLTFNGNVTLGSGKTIQGLSITNNGTNTLNIAAGKTLTVSNTLTFTGTDGSSVAFGSGGTVCYTSSGCNAANTNTGSGSAGQVAFYTGTNTQSSDSNLVWDNTNKRLGIGATPVNKLDVNGGVAIGTYAGVNTAPTGGMVISGAVGIGVGASVNAKLQVAGGNILLDNTRAVTFLDTGGNANGVLAYTSANNLQVQNLASTGNIQITNANDSGGIQFITSSAGGTKLFVGPTGNVGVGTSSPTAELQVKGNTNVALTGTIAVTNGSPNVTGTSTSFTGQIEAGSAILIGGAVYTVSSVTDGTHLILTSNYSGATASGLTAYKDPNLFEVDNGAGTALSYIDRTGTLYTNNSAYITAFGSNIGLRISSGSGAYGLTLRRSDQSGKDINLYDNNGTLQVLDNGGSNTNFSVDQNGAGAFRAGATATTFNGLAITNNGTNTLTIAAGKTLTASNTLTFTGTDGSSVAFGTGGTVCYTGTCAASSVGFGNVSAGTNANALVIGTGGSLSVSGTGTISATSVPLSGITGASTTATIANAANAIAWNWGSITTQTGLALGGGSAMTTGSIFAIGTGTYVHTALNDTGSVAKISFTDASTNANNGGVTNGLNIAATVNTSGAGTKTINGLNVAAPTLTACATGGCTVNGAQVNTATSGAASTITQNGLAVIATGVASGTLNGIYIGGITGAAGTETAISIGSGWDNILMVNSQAILNGSGVLQSAGLSGTYSNTVSFSNASNTYTGASYNGLAITSTTGTLTIASGKTLAANASLTLAGTDNKTLTINNTIAFGGTDSTSFTLPSSNDTLTGIAAAQTLTNKTIGNTGITFAGATSPGTSAAGTGRIYYDSATNRFMASENGGSYINLLGGYNKTITLSPEYAGAVLTADDGTNTNGSMTSDNMLNAGSVGWQSYYQWTSTQATLQDYTVMVRVTLPQDFGSWQTGSCPGSTCALEIGYQTGVTGTTNNAVSARVNNAVNTPGTVICTIADASSTTWSSFGCTSTTLATSPTWNTAGDTAVIRIKLKANSTASALARAGDITLRYVSKF